MGSILTAGQMKEDARIKAAMTEQSRTEIEDSLLQMIHIADTAAARVEALENEIAPLRELLERERKINKAIKRIKGKEKIIAANPDPWFELKSAFNPKTITRMPIEGRVFIMGHIDDVIVVEVPGDSTDEQMRVFQAGLHNMGMTSAAIMVKEGTRFLKMEPVNDEERNMLEGQMEKIDAAEDAEAAREASGEEKIVH